MSNTITIERERIAAALARMEVPALELARIDEVGESFREVQHIAAALGRTLLAYLDAAQRELGISSVGSPYDPGVLTRDIDRRVGKIVDAEATT